MDWTTRWTTVFLILNYGIQKMYCLKIATDQYEINKVGHLITHPDCEMHELNDNKKDTF